jgi:hypothetical protein
MFELFYFNYYNTHVALAFIWKWPGEIQDRLKRVTSEESDKEKGCVGV